MIYSPLDAYVRKDDFRFDGALNKINSPEIKVPGIDGDIGSTMVGMNFPRAKILSLPQTATLSDMILSVITKKADLVFLNTAMFNDFEKTNKGELRKVENVPPSFVFASYFSFNSGEFALRDMLNIPLRKMIDDGRLERIAKSYDPSFIPAKKNY